MSQHNRSTPFAENERVAPGSVPRAGLRHAARADQPTRVFAAVEMSVLVFVAALAMVSIIVSIDEVDAGQRGRPSAEARVQTQDAARVDGVTAPARTDVAQR